MPRRVSSCFHDLNPYNLGPAALPGAFSVEVSHRWIDTPAPYGPLWLYTGKGIAALVGDHVGLTVGALRSLAVIGLILLAMSVPSLAQRAGGDPAAGIWFVVANPITVVLGIGGGHNDLLMVGLMMAGLVVVTRPSWSIPNLFLGRPCSRLRSPIKSPAAVTLAFAIPIWLAGRRTTLRRPSSMPSIVSIASAVLLWSIGLFGLITWVSGLGLGWVKQVNSAASVVSWMSAPTGAAIVWDLLDGEKHRSLKLDPQMSDFRTAGTVLSITVLVTLWTIAMLSATRSANRLWPLRISNPWPFLAIALTSVVVLGPSVQPWYFLWAGAIAAVTRLSHLKTVIPAGLSVGMVAMIRPNGVGLQMNPAVIVILGAGLWWAHFALRSRSMRPTAALSDLPGDPSGSPSAHEALLRRR